VNAEPRPAFYALAPGGWRDYVTLLHPPYTLWHLSYVAIGAGLAPELDAQRLLVALAAFFLAVGLGAHALDELKGRPLRTRISDRVLIVLAAASIGGAVAVGVYASLVYTPWLAPLVAAGAFIVCAYNLELFRGSFHSDAWFAIAWGAFPVLAGYLAVAERISVEALLAGVFAAFLSLAQRHLSTQVRSVRRRVASVQGAIELRDGTREPVTAETLTAVPETALRALTVAVTALAAAILIFRLG
jgi:heme O synthase-like polyprenyltransferase